MKLLRWLLSWRLVRISNEPRYCRLCDHLVAMEDFNGWEIATHDEPHYVRCAWNGCGLPKGHKGYHGGRTFDPSYELAE